MNENSKQLYKKGLQAERSGKLEEAVKIYRTLQKREPQFRPVLVNLGAVYSRLGKSREALHSFKEALKLGEDDIVYFNMGSELFRMKDYATAKGYLIQALKQNHKLLRGHILLAYLYGNLKEPERSRIYFKNALKLDPGNRPALLGLAVSLSETGHYDEALQVIRSTGKLFENDEAVRKLRAALLLQLDRYDDSLREYRNLSATSSRFTSFTEHLQEARNVGQEDYRQMFDSIESKIDEKTRNLKAKLVKRKKSKESGGIESKGNADETVSDEELKEELKEIVDLSLLHLFQGDTDRALRYLMEARKRNPKKKKSDS